MLPVIGTVIGVGLAFERAFAGDAQGAASEAFGALPGIGDVKDALETGLAVLDWWNAPPTGPAPVGKSIGTGGPAGPNAKPSIPLKCPTHHPKPVPKKTDWSSFTIQ